MLAEYARRHADRLQWLEITDKVTDLVMAALDEQNLDVAGTDTYGRIIATLTEDLDRLHARRKTLEAELEQALLAHPLGPVLTSMPGNGIRTGATILVEIGDPARFTDGNKLAAAATSSSPCSRPPLPTSPRRQPNSHQPLDNTMGTPPSAGWRDR